MTEVAEPVDARPEPPARPPGGAGRGWMALALALFVSTAGLAALSASLGSALERERDQRKAVQRVASDFTTGLLTYDFTDLEAAKARVLSLSTGRFRTEYEEAFAGLQAVLTQTEARARAEVTEIFLSSVDGGRAKVIVVADAAAETKSGKRQTIASYIQLDVVRVDGRWLVDGVTNLNFGQQQGDPEPPPTTTTTKRKR